MQDILRLDNNYRSFLSIREGRETSKYYRFIWTPSDVSKRWRRLGGPDAVTPDLELSLKSDVFVTPNEFFGWRNTKSLARLHCNWIDIDTAGHNPISSEIAQAIFDQVCQCVAETNLPSPTGITHTGSGGLHLYWIYDPVDAFPSTVRKWKEIARHLCESVEKARCNNSFGQWQVDYAASLDPTRVLRAPGSIHAKTGNVVTFNRSSEGTSFAILSSLLTTLVQSMNQSSDTDKPCPKIKRNKKSHNIKQWWFRTYTHVLANLQQEVSPVGKRDHYLFILFVALQHIKNDNTEALKRIGEINSRYLKLDDAAVLQYLSSAIKTRYRYRKKTLISYLKHNLKMDTSFLELGDRRPPLSRSEITRRQRKAALITAQKKRLKTQSLIQAAIDSLSKTRSLITAANLHSSTGLSFSTLRRHLVDYGFH